MSKESGKKGLSANWAVTEVDHLFSRIGRYTKFVHFGKWSLLFIAIALLAILIGLPLVTHDRSGIRVSFVESDKKNPPPAASSPVMSNPEYRGSNEKGEQYKINGIRATQITPTLIRIDQVEGQMISPDGKSWHSLTSDTADYDQTSKIIQLSGSVTVIDNQGYSFTTEHATVDTNTSDVTGKDVITGVGPMGNLLATGFEIRDSGAHITFHSSSTDQVHVHIDRTKKQR